MILACALALFACEKAENTKTDIMWVKFNFAAQERCADGHFAKAERELSETVFYDRPEDARYATGLLHLGLLNRVLKRDSAADSLIERSIMLSERVLHVAPRWEVSTRTMVSPS
jgi:hypothetical protein